MCRWAAEVPYGDMFRAPLQIQQVTGRINWLRDANGLTLDGQQLDVQARSLWARGDFRYQQMSVKRRASTFLPGSASQTPVMRGATSLSR